VLQLANLKGVRVIGYVPDTGPYLDRATLSIAPLRFGAGMKGKVTEAMAAGLPVVTTSVGAQGLKVTPGKHLLLADSSSDFANAVVRLLNDPDYGIDLGKNGQKFIASTCGPLIIEKQIEEITHCFINMGDQSVVIRKPIILHFYLFRYYLLLGIRNVARCLGLTRRPFISNLKRHING
jgi:hypothetical protein